MPGGGKGVTLMDLNIGERLLAAKPISAEGVLVTGIGRGNKPREEVVKKNHLQYHLGHRARKGKALDVRWKVKALEEFSAKEENHSDSGAELDMVAEGDTLSLL